MGMPPGGKQVPVPGYGGHIPRHRPLRPRCVWFDEARQDGAGGSQSLAPATSSETSASKAASFSRTSAVLPYMPSVCEGARRAVPQRPRPLCSVEEAAAAAAACSSHARFARSSREEEPPSDSEGIPSIVRRPVAGYGGHVPGSWTRCSRSTSRPCGVGQVAIGLGQTGSVGIRSLGTLERWRSGEPQEVAQGLALGSGSGASPGLARSMSQVGQRLLQADTRMPQAPPVSSLEGPSSVDEAGGAFVPRATVPRAPLGTLSEAFPPKTYEGAYPRLSRMSPERG